MGNLDPLFPTIEMVRKRIRIGIHCVKMIQVGYSEMRTFFDPIAVSRGRRKRSKDLIPFMVKELGPPPSGPTILLPSSPIFFIGDPGFS
jgi:hypothetical protein